MLHGSRAQRLAQMGFYHRFVDRLPDCRSHPLLFMSDIVGRLFREFAVRWSVTILASAVVSLT